MTRILAPDAALLWLATVTPGLQAAALLGSGGELLAGDQALAAGLAGGRAADVAIVRDGSLTLAARVGGPVLRGLLEADMATALAAAARGRIR
jgi:hypothetical protein